MKEIDWANLSFGYMKTDYNVRINFRNGAWGELEISSSEVLNLHMAATCLHYGQEAFEGLKAFRGKDGKVRIFRLEENAARLQSTCQGIMMAELPTERFKEAILKVVKLNERFIPPYESGASLYIRPFMFATERAVGVHPSNAYKFMIILSPVGAYYPEGVNPVKIYVEDEYVRATKGGTGFAKCGGNYAASIAAQVKAEKLGYTQVLWLDGVERKYVEEVGTMNAMFIIDEKIVTAPCDGTVLPGVTRDSVIQLLKSWGYVVEERHLSIDELMEAGRNGKLQEAFGTGTAGVISPIGKLNYKGESITINDFQTGEITQRLYDTLTGIQWGKLEDCFHWTYEVK